MYNSGLAKQIQDAVENAISTCNYTELNKNITNAVNTSIAQIGTSQNRFYQSYADQETTAEERLEHVEGEIVNGDAKADYSARRRAAMEEEQQARYNSRQAQEARRQAAEARRREEAARRKAERARWQYGSPSGAQNRTAGNPYGSSAYSRQRNQQQTSCRNSQRRTRSQTDIVPISRRPAGRVAGTLLTVFGSLGIAASLVLFMTFGMIASFGGISYSTYFMLLSHLFLPCSVISGVMLWSGTKKRHRIKRFYQYVRQLRGRAYCSIRELSSHIGRSDHFVLNDLRKMISLGMFPEGHIDDQETCIMLNGATYDQYRKTQNSYLARKQEEQLKQTKPEHIAAAGDTKAAGNNPPADDASQRSERNLPPEVVQVLSTGKQYITQIREANEAIPGKVISDKLDHLENVIQKIYARIEEHPEQIEELDKFINYYLPTTLKLVNAYRDFDAQPVQGENIQSSKKEIEATLDTIIYAFETLLDSLYEDDALDISTDISVLQTMFAQEGLTKSAFSTKKKQENN